MGNPHLDNPDVRKYLIGKLGIKNFEVRIARLKEEMRTSSEEAEKTLIILTP